MFQKELQYPVKFDSILVKISLIHPKEEAQVKEGNFNEIFNKL